MAAPKISSFRLASLSLVLTVFGLLGGCGEHGSSQAPLASRMESGAKANPNLQCTYVAGRPNKTDEALFGLSGEGDALQVGRLIATGGNVNATDSLKRTPLFAAAFCNRPEVASLLVDKGSAVNARDFLGMSALHAAVLVGGNEAAKVLIAKGADINIRNAAGFTPLHLAAATNRITMVELLLAHGAVVQEHDLDGVAAAALAAAKDHQAVIAAMKKLQEKQKSPRQN